MFNLGFPGGSVLRELPTMQEKKVQSLSREDPLEKEMATHSSILAWEIPWTEEPGGLQSMELQKNQTWLNDQTQHLSLIYTPTCHNEAKDDEFFCLFIVYSIASIFVPIVLLFI